MRFSKGNLSARQQWVLALLFVLPLAVMVAKSSVLPTSGFLMRYASVGRLPEDMQQRVRYILFVPMGAMLVVLFRLTLGIRVLGPFRSILIAVAFQITGIAPGLMFLGLVTVAVVLVRPVLKSIRLPYFGRVSVLLSTVAAIMMLALLSSAWLKAEPLRSLAYFPIVVLCLTAEGFARTLVKEGARSAVWRGGMTALVAVLITLLSRVPGFGALLGRHPEILVAQIGAIVVIAEYFDLRLLQGLNPSPVPARARKRPRERAAKRLGAAAAAPRPRAGRSTRQPSAKASKAVKEK